MVALYFFAFAVTLLHTAFAANSAQWRTQSIYQIMTDRFARTDGSAPSCDVNLYCGGSWRGIIDKLDYIQGMGFTAIYISPVTENMKEETADGEAYHGYWPQDIYAVNENFGSASDLVALAAALHQRNMLLMVDVVVNDMAIAVSQTVQSASDIDYTKFNPFNNVNFYHPYCAITNWNDPANYENCWFSVEHVAMPDLNTESPQVMNMFGSWVKQLVSNYSIDGLRIDGVKQVDQAFFPSFTAASGVFTLGEYYSDDPAAMCAYQNGINGFPNYPVYFPMIQAFTSGDMSNLTRMINTVATSGACSDTSLLGSFSENHDVPRIATLNPDLTVSSPI
jgi:alpha-amylase